QASFFHQALDIASIETASPDADEYGNLAIILGNGESEPVAFAEICAKCPRGKFSEGYDPLFSAFTEHTDELLRHVEVFVIEAGQFTNSQTTRVEEFQDGAIAKVL